MPTASPRSRAGSAATEPDLVGAVRSALAGVKAVTEVKMFGGVGFMLNGNLLVGASGRGLLVRVGKDRQSQALVKPNARPMEMRGRVMDGYIYVDPPVLPGAVAGWVAMARAFVQTLPAKRQAKRRPVKQR